MEDKKKIKTSPSEASFGQRLLALLIDIGVLMILGAFWRGMFGARLYGSISGLLGIAYTILLWVNWNGQTVGKKVLGLRVVTKDGKPLDYKDAILRCLGYIVSSLFLFLGFFWMLWDKNQETWHDKIAKTKVVRV